jgi:hypothetical protein
MSTIEIECLSGMVLEGRTVVIEDLGVFTDKQLAKQSVITGEAALADRLCLSVVDRGPYLFTSPKPPWGQNILYGDLFDFLVQCRIHTRGTNYDYDIQCPARLCREMVPWRLPLDKMRRQWLCAESKEMLRRNENRREVHLTKCDKTVSFQLLDGHVHKRQRRYVKEYGDDIHVIYAARLVKIEGEEKPDFVRFTGQLDPEDFDELDDAIEDADCGLDSAYDVQCPKCDTIFADDLGITPDFFIESFSRRRKRKRWKARAARQKDSPVGESSTASVESQSEAS